MAGRKRQQAKSLVALAVGLACMALLVGLGARSVCGQPILELSKTVTTESGTCPGVESLTVSEDDWVKYCYVVTNTGTAAALNVGVRDDNGTPSDDTDDFTLSSIGLPGLVGLTDQDEDGQEDDLASGATATGEALRLLDTPGTVTNTARAEGQDETTLKWVLSADDSAEVIVEDRIASLSLSKTVTTAGGTCPGGESLTVSEGAWVKYCYVVENTGTAAALNVGVRDDNGTPSDDTDDFTLSSIGLPGLVGLTDQDEDGQEDDLASGATATGEALRLLDTPGTVTNTARAEGRDETTLEWVLSADDSAEVIVEDRIASLSLSKTVTTAGGTCPGGESLTVSEGAWVKYCYVVENTGTAAALNVGVRDDNGTPSDDTDDFTLSSIGLPGLVGLTDQDEDGQEDDLASGATATGEALRLLDTPGTVTNTARAEGQDETTLEWVLSADDSAEVIVTLQDSTPPNAPPTPDLVDASDTGYSNTDDITKYNALTFSGTAEADSLVKLYAEGAQVGSQQLTGGATSWTITSSLADGYSDMTATATDAAGNTSVESGTLSVLIDKGAPPPPGGPNPANNSYTNDDPLIFSWSAPIDPGGSGVRDYHIIVYDSAHAEAKNSYPTNTQYTPTTLADDTYTWKLATRDVAGNTGAWSDEWTFVLDTEAPTISSITSTTLDGCYNVGAIINVTVNFSEEVTLAGGTLDITLDTTGATVSISPFGPATSASGTYTVGAGENSCDLDATNITLNGATLQDRAGNDADMTFPTTTIADGSDMVVDTTNPVINPMASNQTVECDGAGNVTELDTWLNSHGGASATDNCGVVTWTNNFTALSDDCGKTGAALVMFTATDDCSNFSTTSATFTIKDTTPPSISCPADVTIECTESTHPDATGYATGSDTCGDVTITYSDTNVAGCGNTEIITRTWTATDECENSTSCDQIITVVDTTPPSITTLASDETVECDGAGNTTELNTWLANHGDAVANDTCCGTDVTWSNNFTTLSDDCGETGSTLVTFTATDCCGNFSTTSATFMIVDTTSPSITTPASDETVECDGEGNVAELNAWLANNGGAVASDTCCGTDVTWSNDFTALSDDCGETGSALVTFTATDCCGLSSTTQATFTIEDTTNPMIVWNTDLPASPQYVDPLTCTIAFPIHATVTDTCCVLAEDVDVEISVTNAILYEDERVTQVGNIVVVAVHIGIIPLFGWPAVLSVTINANDCCGNAAMRLIDLVEIYDNTVPVINPMASDQTVECDGSGNTADLNTWLNSHGGASATDNCREVMWTNDFTSLSDDCGETGLALVTFTATDDCGNFSTTSATFTIEDTTSPSISCPADVTIECTESTYPDATGYATGSDTCGDVTITYSDTNVAGCGNTEIITRTWTATDECENNTSCDQIITVVDTTPPSISCPADVTIECTESTHPDATGYATGSDTCGDVTITYSDTNVAGCGNTEIITRTWTATDECENSTSCDQIITVVDTTPPSITTLASDETVECDGAGNTTELNTWLANHGDAVANDTCCGTDVTWSNNFTTLSDDCGETGSTLVTFTATDCCGLSATTSATFTIEDTMIPVINELTVSNENVDGCCETTVNFTANVTDNCCIVADNVAVTVTLPTDNAILENIVVSRVQNGQGRVDVTGSADVRCLTSCPARVEVHIEATDCCGNDAIPVTSTAIEGRVYDETPPAPKDDRFRLVVRGGDAPFQLDVMQNDDDNCSSCTCCGTMWIHDIVAPPEYGTVMIESDHGDCDGGSCIRYAPYHGYYGKDEFTYRIVDACGNVSLTATVFIDLIAETVMDDIYLTTCANNSLSFGIGATDPRINPINPDEIPFVFSIFTPPMHGVVSGDLGDVAYAAHGVTTEEIELATITLTYTPAVGFSGRDVLTLRFADPFGGSSTAVVDIAVIECAGQPGAPPLFILQQGEIFPLIVPLTFAVVYEKEWHTVTVQAIDATGTLYNAALSATWEESIGRYVLSLDTASLPPGLYQMTIPLGNGEAVTLMIEVGEAV